MFDPENPDPVEVLRVLLQKIEDNFMCDEGPRHEGWRSNEFDSAIAAGHALVSQRDGENWWTRANRQPG